MRNAKRYLLFVLVALVLITAAGCKKKESCRLLTSIKSKEEINVWLDDEGGEYAAELIKEFNKLQKEEYYC